MGALSQVLSESYAFLKGLLRYRSQLFWLIIFPVLFFVLMTVVFGGGGQSISFNLAVEDLDQGNLSRALIKAINSTGMFKVRVVQGGAIEELVANGTVDVALVVPMGFTHNLTTGRFAYVELIRGNRDGAQGAAASALLSTLSAFEHRFSTSVLERVRPYVPQGAIDYLVFLVNPIEVRERELNVSTGGPGPKAFLAMGTIGVTALFTGLYVGIGSLVERRREGSLALLVSSPMRSTALFLSDTLAGLLAVAISSLAIVATSVVLGTDYSMVNTYSALVIAFLVAVGTLGTIGLGLLISPLVRTPEVANAVVNALTFPIMFASGLIIPKWLLPSWLTPLGDYFPLSKVIDAVREIVIYGQSPQAALGHSLPAIIASLAICLVGALVYRWELTKAADNPF